MSTGLACQIIEFEPFKWFYILEDYTSPRDAWDWREFATAYGPFLDEIEAELHLQRNHANPGGFSILEHKESFKSDQTLVKLIREAQR